MVKEIVLNDTVIKVKRYKEEKIRGLHNISIHFDVTSDEYHDVTTMLYKGTFDVKVPERDLMFKGKIQEYSTSITNLYEKGRVGDFTLSLLEVKN
ncbi:DUF3219 family protein [Bacillus sp. V3B]|uniref:DUF3219 family protein n=1 Tax=Bacillus sp. V3B TaxID=2804915 RepID=UPI00210F068B|nr:DUF3219 family protein [Bacillus sp. V3B]MCQ6274929.1 DUF3219 family protein [Bacillus sp. V3B]